MPGQSFGGRGVTRPTIETRVIRDMQRFCEHFRMSRLAPGLLFFRTPRPRACRNSCVPRSAPASAESRIKQWPQPLGDRFCQIPQLAAFENGDTAKWRAQVAVVVDPDVRQSLDGQAQVGESPRA